MRSCIIIIFALFSSANAATISRNARCGLQGGGTTCLNSQWGSCCSQYGWCGSTNAYCGTGCQGEFGTCQGRSSSSSRIVTSTLSPVVRPSSTSSRSPTPVPSQRVSTNARCGPAFNGQTCQGSRYGNCCSKYFYCGSTDDYCRPDSCQVGYGQCNIASSSSRSSTRLSTSSSRSSTQMFSPSTTLSTIRSTLSSSSSSPSVSSAVSTPVISSSTVLSLSSPQVLPSSSTVPSSSGVSSSPAVSSSSSETPMPTPTPQVTQFVQNPSFDDGSLAPWIFTGNGLDQTQTGVGSLSPRTGPNSFQAVGSNLRWSFGLTQTFSVEANRAYTFAFYSRTGGTCSGQYQVFGTTYTTLASATYQRTEMNIPANAVTSTSTTITFIYGCAIDGAAGALFIDDVTLTISA